MSVMTYGATYWMDGSQVWARLDDDTTKGLAFGQGADIDEARDRLRAAMVAKGLVGTFAEDFDEYRFPEKYGGGRPSLGSTTDELRASVWFREMKAEAERKASGR